MIKNLENTDIPTLSNIPIQYFVGINFIRNISYLLIELKRINKINSVGFSMESFQI